VAGSQFFLIIIRLIRSKAIAVWIGPSGVGLIGICQAAIDLIRSMTGLGLNFSGVKEVAQASVSNDEIQIATTMHVLRKWVWATGLFGMVLTASLSHQLSVWSFGNTEHTYDFIILSVIVFIGAISTGQTTLLQGLRKIKEMSQANILGSFFGLIISLPVYWYFGEEGIIPSLVITTGASLFFSWFFAHKIKNPKVVLSIKETFWRGKGMVELGMTSVFTGLTTTASAYLIRLVISKDMGLVELGLFQAAWGISMVYLQMVFTAMGSDYYPRLVAVCHEETQTNQVINEQSKITLLLAGPMVIVFMSFADIIIRLLYSGTFDGAVVILEWQLLGTLFKAYTWPFGFLLPAKNLSKWFIFTELFWNVLFLTLCYCFVNRFGIEVTGIAYFITYVIYFGLVYAICRTQGKYYWTKDNIGLALMFCASAVVVLLNNQLQDGALRYSIDALISILIVSISLYKFDQIISLRSVMAKFKAKIGIR
jgi:O-antigen/teichoic acid export membrane protein